MFPIVTTPYVIPDPVLELGLASRRLLGVESKQALHHIQTRKHGRERVVVLAGLVCRAPKNALIASPMYLSTMPFRSMIGATMFSKYLFNE